MPPTKPAITSTIAGLVAGAATSSAVQSTAMPAITLRGRASLQPWTSEANGQAKEFFAKAMELDPFFALAYGGLSYTHIQAWLAGWERSPESLRRARELALPVRELRIEDSARQPISLPNRVVSVLDRRIRQATRIPPTESLIQDRDLLDENSHRPSVADDVVNGE